MHGPMDTKSVQESFTMPMHAQQSHIPTKYITVSNTNSAIILTVHVIIIQ